jgi:hypothetical protein
MVSSLIETHISFFRHLKNFLFLSGFYCSPGVQQIYLFQTVFILVVGLSAPWVEMKVMGRNIKPFIFAFLVILGLIPFNHWLLITPSHHTNNLVVVRISCFIVFLLIFD